MTSYDPSFLISIQGRQVNGQTDQHLAPAKKPEIVIERHRLDTLYGLFTATIDNHAQ